MRQLWRSLGWVDTTVQRAFLVGGLVAAVAVAAAIGLSGCALGGDAVSRQQENLENQRKVASGLVTWQGGVETIRFTDEGSRPGLGASWRARAVVTIQGAEYQLILGMRAVSGDRLPDISPGTPPIPVTVIFSDGSEAVIQ